MTNLGSLKIEANRKLTFMHGFDILADLFTGNEIDQIAKKVVSEHTNFTDAVRALEKRLAEITDRHDFLWCNVAAPLARHFWKRSKPQEKGDM